MPEVRLAFRPFQQQADFFRRKVSVPSARWDDLQRENHAHGFMVAGLARMDVLDDIRQAIGAAIERGESLADFRARFDSSVLGKWEGFTGSESEARRAWRTRVIYKTNMRTAYMAGRWEQLEKFPYLRYQHNTVANPREQHQAWDGLIIATSDPWWETHYPPNGWGCACTATGISEARLRAMGKSGPDGAPPAVLGDPPPEWAYHVGKAARSLPAASAFGEKVMQLPDAWRAAALADAQRRSVDWFADWRGFVHRVVSEIDDGLPRPTGAATPIGFLSANAALSLAAGRGLDGRRFAPTPPRTALLATTDRAIYHGLRDAKWADRRALRQTMIEALVDLPSWSRAEGAVTLWREASPGVLPTLAIARPIGGGRYAVMLIRLDLREGRAAQPAAANWVRSVEIETRDTLRDFVRIAGDW